MKENIKDKKKHKKTIIESTEASYARQDEHAECAQDEMGLDDEVETVVASTQDVSDDDDDVRKN